MKVLIVGVSCVGKTTVGKLLAQKLNYEFKDLDQENIKKFGTIQSFLDQYPNDYERALNQKDTIATLLSEDCVIAITPLGYEFAIQEFLMCDDIEVFELRDRPEHIFNRLIFTDDDDQIYEDSEAYKLEHAEYYLNEINEDLKYYGNVYKNVKNKIYIDGASVEETANLIYEQLIVRSKI